MEVEGIVVLAGCGEALLLAFQSYVMDRLDVQMWNVRTTCEPVAVGSSRRRALLQSACGPPTLRLFLEVDYVPGVDPVDTVKAIQTALSQLSLGTPSAPSLYYGSISLAVASGISNLPLCTPAVTAFRVAAYLPSPPPPARALNSLSPFSPPPVSGSAADVACAGKAPGSIVQVGSVFAECSGRPPPSPGALPAQLPLAPPDTSSPVLGSKSGLSMTVVIAVAAAAGGAPLLIAAALVTVVAVQRRQRSRQTRPSLTPSEESTPYYASMMSHLPPIPPAYHSDHVVYMAVGPETSKASKWAASRSATEPAGPPPAMGAAHPSPDPAVQYSVDVTVVQEMAQAAAVAAAAAMAEVQRQQHLAAIRTCSIKRPGTVLTLASPPAAVDTAAQLVAQPDYHGSLMPGRVASTTEHAAPGMPSAGAAAPAPAAMWAAPPTSPGGRTPP